MYISCIIYTSYGLLVDKFMAEDENVTTLPTFHGESVEQAQKLAIEKLGEEEIEFVFGKEIFKISSGDEKYSLILCPVLSQVGYENMDSYKWEEFGVLPSIRFHSQNKEMTDAINGYFAKRENLLVDIRAMIEELHGQKGVKLMVEDQFDTIAFWVQHPNFFIPFFFTVEYFIDENNRVEYRTKWRTCRQYVPGDKSDLYLLFTETMGMLLKLMNKPVYVGMYNYLGTEPEIHSAEIIFEGEDSAGVIEYSEFAKRVIALFEEFNIIMGIHGRVFGSISYKLAKDVDENIIAYFGEEANYVVREESCCYYNDDMAFISFSNGEYDSRNLLAEYSYNLLKGVTGTLLYAKIFDKEINTNYIPSETFEKVSEVAEKFSIKDYGLICQSNRLYMLFEESVLIFNGDFHHSKTGNEEKQIQFRQDRENALIHINRSYKWKYPVNPGRFEHLIADIIECQHPDAMVRLVGKANNSDGGRDIIVTYGNREYLKQIIWQCKAYSHSVNKSNVINIRDTIEYYNASGFHLAVTSQLTTQLIDHLMALKRRYDVDWWTEREIFKILRQYHHIADEYRDILEIVD